MAKPFEPTTFRRRAELDRVAQALRLPSFEPGWVWLAGAGPGEPGLITVLGLHAITRADVILHDALIDEALLALAAPGAELIYVGKRAGRKSCKQTDISRTLISLARKGKRVLRLKGGDPLVFGRGAEEALTLAASQIPFRIVPGVTAAIGGLAYAGIPVTHRDTNHVVTFVTGHGADGKLPAHDWRAIARGSPTIVVYMGTRYAGEIARHLIDAGRLGEEPAAIVTSATTGEQTVRVTELRSLGETATGISGATLIVIGENVRLRRGMDWLGAMSGVVLDPDSLQRNEISDAV